MVGGMAIAACEPVATRPLKALALWGVSPGPSPDPGRDDTVTRLHGLLALLLITAGAGFCLASALLTPAGAADQRGLPGAPYGGPIRLLLADPQDARRVYAGTLHNGLFRSSDGGASWQSASTGLPPNSSISVLVADPDNPSTLYAVADPTDEAAAAVGSLYKSVDSGATWRATGAGLPSSSVTGLVVSPQVASTLYAATAAGLYRSADGGATWSPMGGAAALTAILVSPQKQGRVFAGFSRGIYRSDDGGLTWTPVAADGPASEAYVNSFVVDPINPSLIYAATSGTGILRSTNGGFTWEAVNHGLSTPYVLSLTLCPSSPRLLYAGTADGVYRTTSSGEAWQQVALGGARADAVVCSPANLAVAYAGSVSGGGVVKTTDSGTSWAPANGGLANLLVEDIAVVPDGAALLLASGDGLTRSADNGATWAFTALGRGATASVSASTAPGAHGVVYAALRTSPALVRSGLSSSAVARSTDGGVTWQIVGLQGQGPTLVRASPLTPSLVYAATTGGVLYRSADSGATWQPVYGGAGSGARRIVTLALDPHNAQRVYLTTSDTAGVQLLVSSDGGASWRAARLGAASGAAALDLLSVVADPVRPGQVYAAGNGVYRSADGGATWQDTGLLRNLPNLRLLATPAGLYAISDGRLFRSTDVAVTWRELMLPVAPADVGRVYSLAQGNDGALYLGTTRGLLTVSPAVALPSPTGRPGPTGTPTVTAAQLTTTALRTSGLLSYVPVNALNQSVTPSLTLFNAHATTSAVDLSLAVSAASSLHLVLSPWQVLRVPVTALLAVGALQENRPTLIAVRASQPLALRGDHTIALDAARPMQPSDIWYLTTGPAPRRVLWVMALGTRPTDVTVEVHAAGRPTRRLTVLVDPHHAQQIALDPLAGPGGFAAVVRSADHTPLVVLQASAARPILQMGASTPARAWYYTFPGAEARATATLTLYNPTAARSVVSVAFCHGGRRIHRGMVLAPGALVHISFSGGLVAATVSSSTPLVAQAEIASPSAGTPQWEEGTSALGVSWVEAGLVSLFNPTAQPARLLSTPLQGGGSVRTYTVAPWSSVEVGAINGKNGGGQGVLLQSTLPLVLGQGLPMAGGVAPSIALLIMR